MSYTKVHQTRTCAVCATPFTTSDGRRKYCSDRCKRGHNSREFYLRHKNSRYYHFHRLLTNRPLLSQEILEEIFQQQYGLCALSQEPMTWFAGQGRIRTNISVDRITAGGEYTKENIRLVCSVVNSMRNNMSDEELLLWCGRIYNG